MIDRILQSIDEFKTQQPRMLREILDKGVPITYRNDQGQLVKEMPNGNIIVLEEPTMSEQIDRYFHQARAAQPAILESMLNAGVPVRYTDDQGRYVQKNPNRSITVLAEADE